MDGSGNWGGTSEVDVRMGGLTSCVSGSGMGGRGLMGVGGVMVTSKEELMVGIIDGRES